MAFKMARRSVVRGRPMPAGSGIRGFNNAHSASVASLANRRPSRRYCGRVISVQGMVSSIESSQIRRNHIQLKSLTTFRPDFQDDGTKGQTPPRSLLLAHRAEEG